MDIDHITLKKIEKFEEIRTSEKVSNNVEINGHVDEESVEIKNQNQTKEITTNFFQEGNTNYNLDEYKIIFNKKLIELGRFVLEQK